MSTNTNHKGWFICFAQKAATWTGNAYAFLTAAAIVLIWMLTGPLFEYSDTWQLVINTGTTIVTFLMVFLIQNTQNRDSKAMQLKLDELIRAIDGAHTVLLDLEEMSEEDLENIREKYQDIAAIARKRLRSGKQDTDIPQIILDEKIELKKTKNRKPKKKLSDVSL
jgi:low affinity Fe/Cu permease